MTKILVIILGVVFGIDLILILADLSTINPLSSIITDPAGLRSSIITLVGTILGITGGVLLYNKQQAEETKGKKNWATYEIKSKVYLEAINLLETLSLKTVKQYFRDGAEEDAMGELDFLTAIRDGLAKLTLIGNDSVVEQAENIRLMARGIKEPLVEYYRLSHDLDSAKQYMDTTLGSQLEKFRDASTRLTQTMRKDLQTYLTDSN